MIGCAIWNWDYVAKFICLRWNPLKSFELSYNQKPGNTTPLAMSDRLLHKFVDWVL